MDIILKDLDFIAGYKWIFILSFLILVLVIALIKCVGKIRDLKKALINEIHKRIIPYLIVEFNMFDFTLDLKNDGYCAVRDIKISDIVFSVDVGFQKTLRLIFKPIEFLSPGKKQRIEYTVYDKDQKLPSSMTDRLGSHMANASFSMTLECKNLENVAFGLLIRKEKDEFKLIEVKPKT